MCGITGIFHYRSAQPVSAEILKRMIASISHRGPDDDRMYIDHDLGVGFGHRRLSIIDLATGQQPMSNAAQDIWIVFNGEIYNFLELKKELQAKGYQFRTNSDTEVILYFYEAHGEKAFGRLNGIFAFAIFDKRKRCVVLARDHFGVKPLYYTLHDGALLFGSEIKALFQDSSIPKELDDEAFDSFLTFRYNPSPQTLFKNVKKLSPGSFLKVKHGGDIELASYWDYQPGTNNKISEEEAIREYQRLLENAVRRQMISDVPVGLLLSGGIDSAIIGHLMQQAAREKIKTFTIGFGGKGDYNELDDARRTAEWIGSEHYDITLSRAEYLDFFFRSFYYTEEPIAQTTIPALYYVAKLASRHLKVVLAGQGADEPLAGYPRYLGEQYLSQYAGVLQMLPLKPLAALLPRNERLQRLVYASQFSTELQRFLGIYTIFTPAQKNALLNGEVKKRLRNEDEALVQRWYSQTGALKDSLSKLLFIDTRTSLPDNLLLFGDKMTMANSLEMRVPFLDVELIRFLESLPAAFKLKGRTGKYIHKKAAAKWLPKEIVYRKKRNFATPMDEWLQADLAVSLKKLLNAKDSACRQYFNLGFVNSMIEQHRTGKANFSTQLFMLISFEFWHRHFLQREKLDEVVLAEVGAC